MPRRNGNGRDKVPAGFKVVVWIVIWAVTVIGAVWVTEDRAHSDGWHEGREHGQKIEKDKYAKTIRQANFLIGEAMRRGFASGKLCRCQEVQKDVSPPRRAPCVCLMLLAHDYDLKRREIIDRVQYQRGIRGEAPPLWEDLEGFPNE